MSLVAHWGLEEPKGPVDASCVLTVCRKYMLRRNHNNFGNALDLHCWVCSESSADDRGHLEIMNMSISFYGIF